MDYKLDREELNQYIKRELEATDMFICSVKTYCGITDDYPQFVDMFEYSFYILEENVFYKVNGNKFFNVQPKLEFKSE